MPKVTDEQNRFVGAIDPSDYIARVSRKKSPDRQLLNARHSLRTISGSRSLRPKHLSELQTLAICRTLAMTLAVPNRTRDFKVLAPTRMSGKELFLGLSSKGKFCDSYFSPFGMRFMAGYRSGKYWDVADLDFEHLRSPFPQTLAEAMLMDLRDLEEFGDRDLLRQIPLWTSSSASLTLIAQNPISPSILPFFSGSWEFWHDWYQGFLDGTPLDWELQRRVALIDDTIWEAGPEAVAKEIEIIKAEFLAEKADVRETLIVDEDTKTFSVRALPVSKQDVLRVAVERAEDALDDVLAIGQGNGLTENTVEARILGRLFRKYREDPQRVAFDYVEVNLSIRRNIDVGEFPKDSAHQILSSALTVGVTEICKAEPEIREALERNYDRPEPEAPTEADVLLLTDAMRAMPDMSDEWLGAQFKEDFVELLYGEIVDDAPEADAKPHQVAQIKPRASVLRRLASRIATMWTESRARKVLSDHYESDDFKSVRVVVTYGGGMGLLASLMGLLAGLLGVF